MKRIITECIKISSYVDNGFLTEERELYYPVRLKPAGKFTLSKLMENGTDHIELRMIDLNPFAEDGIDIRDMEFLKLFLIWLASREMEPLTKADQVQAIQNYKNAAGYDWNISNITDINGSVRSLEAQLGSILEEMMEFYAEDSPQIKGILEYQYSKVVSAENRYAFRVRDKFERDYIREGIRLAINKQEKANV